MQRGGENKLWLYIGRASEIPVEWEKTAQFKKAVIQLRILNGESGLSVRKICRS